MKDNAVLTVASLLAILLTSLHHAGDVVRELAPGGLSNLVPIVFLLVWLYATLALAGRRAGYILILVQSLLASGLPVVHMLGSGLAGGGTAGSSGALFFAWTLLALGVTALFSATLAARELWSLRKRK